MSLEDEILMMVKPLIKGHIDLGGGILLFGRMWMDWETDHMRAEIEKRGISHIWNLREQSHGGLGVTEIWSPVPDYGVPNDSEAFLKDANAVLAALNNGKTVLVHCYGGKGRTSMAIATVLVKTGMDREEALNKAGELANGPETEEQKEFVRSIRHNQI